jgi:hypothetical protein
MSVTLQCKGYYWGNVVLGLFCVSVYIVLGHTVLGANHVLEQVTKLRSYYFNLVTSVYLLTNVRGSTLFKFFLQQAFSLLQHNFPYDKLIFTNDRKTCSLMILLYPAKYVIGEVSRQLYDIVI